VITNYLKGIALQLLIKYTNSGETSWKKFTRILLDTFKPVDYGRRLRQQLRELKQTDSVDNYNRKYLSLINQLEGLTEDEKILNYIEGLCTNTKFQVLSKSPRKLEEAISTATQFETCCNKQSISSISDVNMLKKVNFVKHRKNFKQEYDKNKRSNYKMTKPYSQPIENRFNKDKIKCYKCQKMGHISKNCRSYDKKQSIKPSNMVEPVVSQILTIKNAENIESLLHVNGKISGIPLTMSLDSGSTVSIISAKIVKAYNIDVLPSNIKVKTANNAISDVIGITNELLTEVHGHSCSLQFVVLDHDDHEVLLGLNWFMATGAGLFPKQNILKFPGETIELFHNTIEETRVDDDYEDVMQAEIADEADIKGDTDWELPDNIGIQPQVALSNEQNLVFENLKIEASSLFASS